MMSSKSVSRVQSLVDSPLQIVMFVCWNKHFAVNFKHRNMAAIKRKGRVTGKGEYRYVFTLFLVRLLYWCKCLVSDKCLKCAIFRDLSALQKKQFCEDKGSVSWIVLEVPHEWPDAWKHWNIPSTWLDIMLGWEPSSSANYCTPEKL